MKVFRKLTLIQKIAISLVIVILVNFAIPKKVEAFSIDDIIEGAINAIIELFMLIPDGLMTLLQRVILGGRENASLHENPGKQQRYNPDTKQYEEVPDEDMNIVTVDEDFSGGESFIFPGVVYPNIKLSPEEMFANKVPALDINFISPSQTQKEAQGETNNLHVAVVLRDTIRGWYNALKLIAIIGLLSVLIYLGIRLMLSSTAQNKANYKQAMWNWIVALIIVFFIHYVMSFILVLSDNIIGMITRGDTLYNIRVQYLDEEPFDTNLIGLIRFYISDDDYVSKFGYIILYMALIFQTLKFLLVYLKRVLNMAFLTVIAPIVALTYPIDKVGDGSAQAFNLWWKEYLFNALLQPFHLLLYTILVSSSAQIMLSGNDKGLAGLFYAAYAFVCLQFMPQAEKMLKSMFGFEKASMGTVGGMGSIARTALTHHALNKISGVQGNGFLGRGSNKTKTKNSDGGGSEGKSANNKPVNANEYDPTDPGNIDPLGGQDVSQRREQFQEGVNAAEREQNSHQALDNGFGAGYSQESNEDSLENDNDYSENNTEFPENGEQIPEMPMSEDERSKLQEDKDNIDQEIENYKGTYDKNWSDDKKENFEKELSEKEGKRKELQDRIKHDDRIRQQQEEMQKQQAQQEQLQRQQQKEQEAKEKELKKKLLMHKIGKGFKVTGKGLWKGTRGTFKGVMMASGALLGATAMAGEAIANGDSAWDIAKGFALGATGGFVAGKALGNAVPNLIESTVRAPGKVARKISGVSQRAQRRIYKNNPEKLEELRTKRINKIQKQEEKRNLEKLEEQRKAAKKWEFSEEAEIAFGKDVGRAAKIKAETEIQDDKQIKQILKFQDNMKKYNNVDIPDNQAVAIFKKAQKETFSYDNLKDKNGEGYKVAVNEYTQAFKYKNNKMSEQEARKRAENQIYMIDVMHRSR